MAAVEKFVLEGIIQLIIILAGAKFAGFVFEKLKQPKVLGELFVGLLLGSSVLGLIDINNEIVIFIANLGVIALLFEVGIESRVSELLRTGFSSLLVALIGVILPLLLAMIYGIYFLEFDTVKAFFLGSVLTATSVGLTVRVLQELDKVNSTEGKIILGAAVTDDVLGLILLSILVDIERTGSVVLGNIAMITALALAFLIASVLIGRFLEDKILRVVKMLKVKRTFIVAAFIFALFMSFIAIEIGLAAIVGAFAAGLILESKEHVEKIWEKTHVLTQLFAPVFFVTAGAAVNLESLFNLENIILIVVLTIIACIGKIVSGFGAFREKASKLAIGYGMMPRGEVGLIFAQFGLTAGLVGEAFYSVLVSVIMITTFLAPPLLKAELEKFYGKNKKKSGK